MSFVVYDIIFLVLFILVVGIFLYRHRSKAKWEGILLLYRTQVGVKFIDYVDQHYGKWIGKLKWVIIGVGYVSMVVMTFLLFQLLYVFIKVPEVVRAVKIPPLAPLIPYLPELFNADFLPPFYFTYWIIAIAVIALSHEFAHGIFARINKVKVKSTGFGFLGPFLAAFVEPDEEEMQKIRKSDQLAILGAGSFANLIMTAVFMILLWIFFSISFVQAGVVFNTYAFSVSNMSDIDHVGEIAITSELPLLAALDKKNRDSLQIKKIDGHNFTAVSVDGGKYYLDVDATLEHLESNFTRTLLYEDTPALQAGLRGVIVKVGDALIRNHADLRKELDQKNPGDSVRITTLVDKKEEKYEVTLGEHPETGRAFLGITVFQSGRGLLSKLRNFAFFFKDPQTYYKPKFNHGLIVFIYDLLWWIILINLSVALVNMLPLGIFDGGRVFLVTMAGILGNEKRAKVAYKVATHILLLVFLLLMVAWAWHTF